MTKESVGNCGVYIIRNNVTGKVYVGSSKDIAVRKVHHYYELRSGRHANSYLQSSWKKHGESAFSFYVCCLCLPEVRADIEGLVVVQHGSMAPSGYNMMCPRLKIVSPETRIRMSERMKGVNTWMKGRKLSPETIAKRTAKMLGRKNTVEQRMNYRASKMGSRNPNYKISDEQCTKVRELMKTKTPRAEIAKMFGISVSHVFSLAKGHRRSITQLSRIEGRN